MICAGKRECSFKNNYSILAGQAAPYILRQLNDFKQRRRSDPNMDPIAAQLSDEDMRDLTAYLASLEPFSSPVESDPMKGVRGKKTAERAQCTGCHLGGANSGGTEFPRIQGQHRTYLVKQLRNFRAGRRSNDNGHMQGIAKALTDADVEDLGNYFASMRVDDRQRKRR